MHELNTFLRQADYAPVFNAAIAAAGLVVCALILIGALHTLHVLGQQTPLYRKHRPVAGWNRRFYVATALMIIGLLSLMLLLSSWRGSA